MNFSATASLWEATTSLLFRLCLFRSPSIILILDKHSASHVFTANLLWFRVLFGFFQVLFGISATAFLTAFALSMHLFYPPTPSPFSFILSFPSSTPFYFSFSFKDIYWRIRRRTKVPWKEHDKFNREPDKKRYNEKRIFFGCFC